MQFFRTLLMVFGATFPFVSWLYAAVLLTAFVPAPGFVDQATWEQFIWLTSPVFTWMLIAILDATEIMEYDKKGGRLNWIISWALIIYCWFAEPGQFGYIPQDSSVWIPAVLVTVLATAWALARIFLRPGSFRRALDREISLYRYGTTWKPAKVKDHGSARLGDVKVAAKYYQDQEIIFGTAKEDVPEADSIIAAVIRKGLNAGRVSKGLATAIFVDPFRGKNMMESIKVAWKSNSNDPAKTPILSGSFNGHMLVVSGSGGGKTASFVIPNALTYKGGSMLVVDPKSEIYEVTKRARQEKGHTAYILKPGDINTDSFNCIGWIDPDNPSFTKDCMTVSSWIFPDEGGDEGGGAGYYEETAKRLFAFSLAYNLANWKKLRDEGEVKPFPTLVDIYNFLFQSPADLQDAIIEINDEMEKLDETSVVYGTATQQIRTWAASFVGGDMEKTWPNTVSSVQKNFWWIGDRSNNSIVSGTPYEGGNGRAFKAGDITNGKTSVYVCIPLAVLESTPGLARLVIGSFLNAIFQAEGKTKGSTLFMIDEMQVLGNFPILHQTALNQGRGFGISLAGIIQAPDALEKQAGKGVYTSWVDNTMLQMFFAIGGEETAEKISKQIGETTVEDTAYSGGTQKQRGAFLGADNSGGLNVSVSRHSRRLKTATEVMNLDRTYAVIFRRVGVDDERVGKLPMIVGTCFYKGRPELMELADDNPYERKGVDDEGTIEGIDLNQDLVALVVNKVKERQAEEAGSEAKPEAPAAEKAKEEEPYIADEWQDYDVKATARAMAESDPEMKRIINIIDRYFADESTVTDEEMAILQANDLVSLNADEDALSASFQPTDLELEEKYQREILEYEHIEEDDVIASLPDDITSSSEIERQILIDAQEIEEMTGKIGALNLIEHTHGEEDMQALLDKIKGMS